ncbi:MAG: ADP-ribosylglycohydrolase family protein [Chloroflexi bacterium]|nr:ADP-ribosylglycohydrolase family protein [Chloroflexota bacterium]
MIPQDYVERVYAGVLGKMIGVYLGRPFEGWTYEQIISELGEITGYVHEQLDKPLIVTDDDLTGTFTFLRALADNDYPPDLTPAQIGQTWLNYIIENRTILWWGGVGHSTEHTAYTRLKSGIPAPQSGSIDLNGRIIAEQIGSQIFIDGWGMVTPGDPEHAADLARRAASVSHDGEGIYGAQVVAAMAALAFVESDLAVLLDTAVSLIPTASTVYRLIADVRDWHAREPDWRVARNHLAARYGYDKFGGNCHIIPNHGLIMLSLLYGDDDLRRSLMIVNTCGWDTDCNSGNVGCLLGIKNGLAGIETIADLRRPLDDRLYLPTADGGRAITDAVQETYAIANAGRALQNLPSLAPKNGARFHFSLPGSVQNFRAQDEVTVVENVLLNDKRYLALTYHLSSQQPGFVGTDTFIPPDAKDMPGYELLASPTLYSGQTVRAHLIADTENQGMTQVGLYLRHYGADDELVLVRGPKQTLAPGQAVDVVWQIPAVGGDPIAEIGVWTQSETAVSNTLYLDYLTWDGEPDVTWKRPFHNGTMWQRAWVDGIDHYYTDFAETFRVVSNKGCGLLIQGTRQWQNVAVQSTITPHFAKRFGLATRVQGLQRYYALLLDRNGRVELVRVFDTHTVLAMAEIEWDGERPLSLRLQIVENKLQGWVDGSCMITAVDSENKLTGGGIALVIEEGCVVTDVIQVQPALI